ncbi:MAG TPA: hypothetical protein VFL57_14680 [Bryobacteraceae bacterium]|nr:hypothetical protein [Bryobacteraceae bacterium]
MSKPLADTKSDTASPLRSGGPQTHAGKQRSAGNATRHGVLSNKMIVLQSECHEEYEHLRASYYGELQPVGVMESELVDEMIWAKWRQRRAITCETATIDLQMDAEADEVEQTITDIDDSTRTAHAIRTLANESRDLDLLNRYETRFHRMFHRAFRQLLELQDRRRRDGQPVETKELTPALEPENKKLPNEQPGAPARAAALPENVNLPNEQPKPGPVPVPNTGQTRRRTPHPTDELIGWARR